MTNDEAVEMVANALAERRLPPSTVYMDGSHNPTPMEYQTARELVSLIRAAQRNQTLREVQEAAREIRAEEEGYPKDWLLMWESLTDRIDTMRGTDD